MTFNQWLASTGIETRAARLALEPIWNDLISAGHAPSHVAARLRDLMDTVWERRS